MKFHILGFKFTVIAGALAAASPLWAAEWTIAPQVQIQTAHDSNLRLTPDQKDSALQSSATASVAAKRRTETSDVSVTGGYTYIDYQNAGPTIRNLDQQFFQGVMRKRWDRWAVGATGSFRRDDLLRTIRETFDSGEELGIGADSETLDGDPPNDELGIDTDGTSAFEVAEQVRRTLWRGAGYGQYELTERDRLRFGYGYSKRDYSAGALQTGIPDNKRSAIDFQYARDLSDRSVLTSSLSAAKLSTTVSGLTNLGDVLRVKTSAKFYQGLVSWRARYTENSRLELGAGISHVDSDIESNTGFLVRLRGSTSFANGKILGEVRRALAPNIFGNVATTDILRMRYSRAINQFVGLDVDVSGQRRRTDRNDRDHIFTNVTATWAVTPLISLGSTYGYSVVKRARDDENGNPSVDFTNSGTGRGHSLMLTLTYRPQIIRIGQ